MCLQARAENYIESIAFVRLLNALLKASGGALPDDGRPYAHFQDFVRLELLGQINQRGYKCASLLNWLAHFYKCTSTPPLLPENCHQDVTQTMRCHRLLLDQ
jgi:hypothetical protein